MRKIKKLFLSMKGVYLKLENGYHNTKEFVEFAKEYSKDKHNDHNQWPDKYKAWFKWFLVFAEIKSFLTIFYILSGSIISEKITGVNLFGIHMYIAIIILVITSYFSKSMYKDKEELRNAYIKAIIVILLSKAFLLV